MCASCTVSNISLVRSKWYSSNLSESQCSIQFPKCDNFNIQKLQRSPEFLLGLPSKNWRTKTLTGFFSTSAHQVVPGIWSGRIDFSQAKNRRPLRWQFYLRSFSKSDATPSFERNCLSDHIIEVNLQYTSAVGTAWLLWFFLFLFNATLFCLIAFCIFWFCPRELSVAYFASLWQVRLQPRSNDTAVQRQT